MSVFSDVPIEINSPNIAYTADAIESKYTYTQTVVEEVEGGRRLKVTPVSHDVKFHTVRKAPKTGVMLVGWGGNNGTTLTAGLVANREKLSWPTKHGDAHANFYGSLTQCSTVKLGSLGDKELYVPFKNVLPMVNPCDLVVGGWDINSMSIGDAMRRAEVFDYAFQERVYPFLKGMTPLPSLYYPDFIASNQGDRANHVLPGSDKQQHLEKIREDIRSFKASHGLETVIVLWTANTERFSELVEGVNDTWASLKAAIARSESEVSPSTIFAVAAIEEGCTYINGSPQNTFVPGVVELAEAKQVYIAGSDFKSGQTKIKSVLTDFLISGGLKPTSVVSYNHLGNNDGKNLSSPLQFRSKEISKSSVIDDMVESNGILYAPGEHPDHVVVIKYVPNVGDSKRALDEYTSQIFCGGLNTISMHNTCEDSLLAAPLMTDLVVLAELMNRITVKVEGSAGFERFHSILSVLSYLTKAPEVPRGTPVINSLFKQRECILNLLRACLGLPADDHMLLEWKLQKKHF